MFHHMFLGTALPSFRMHHNLSMSIPVTLSADFKKEYPDAKVIAVDAAKAKKEVAGAGLKFDGGTLSTRVHHNID